MSTSFTGDPIVILLIGVVIVVGGIIGLKLHPFLALLLGALFQAMGKNIVHIGEPGAGQTTKACNQMIVGMTIQAVAEAFTLARKAGVNLEKMREALLGGFEQSRILDLHGKRIIDGNFKPGFKVRLHRKDMNIALQTGKEFSVPLYGCAQVAAHMDALLAQGHGDLDHSAMVLLMEKLSNGG